MTRPRTNPFASLIDASAVIAVCQQSERLVALPAQAHLCGDRPGAPLGKDVADYDASIDACTHTGLKVSVRPDRQRKVIASSMTPSGTAASPSVAAPVDSDGSGAKWSEMSAVRFPAPLQASTGAVRVERGLETSPAARGAQPGEAVWTASQAWYTRQLASLGLD